MKRVTVLGCALAACGVAGVVALMWPQAKVQAQGAPVVSVEGCSCSKPAVAGAGREQISVYYCNCPGTQCVVTATAAGVSVPPNVVQSCR